MCEEVFVSCGCYVWRSELFVIYYMAICKKEDGSMNDSMGRLFVIKLKVRLYG